MDKEPVLAGKITAYPRIHVALADLGHATQRAYGGAGFSLTEPVTTLRWGPSASFDFQSRGHLDDAGSGAVRSLIARLARRADLPRIALTVESMPPQHVGLGTKTALTLAIVTAIDAAAGVERPRSDAQLVTQRGGASGVGVHTFFVGGLVFDGGHPTDKAADLRPSSGRRPKTVPPLIARLEMPAGWCVLGALPRQGQRFSGAREGNFFEQNTPIPAAEALGAVAHLWHGLAPAVAEVDLVALRLALRNLNRIGFKRREVENQPGVGQLLGQLNAMEGVAVGMSSMGPLVYVIFDQSDCTSSQAVIDVLRAHDATRLFSTSLRNEGYRLEAESTGGANQGSRPVDDARDG